MLHSVQLYSFFVFVFNNKFSESTTNTTYTIRMICSYCLFLFLISIFYPFVCSHVFVSVCELAYVWFCMTNCIRDEYTPFFLPLFFSITIQNWTIGLASAQLIDIRSPCRHFRNKLKQKTKQNKKENDKRCKKTRLDANLRTTKQTRFFVFFQFFCFVLFSVSSFPPYQRKGKHSFPSNLNGNISTNNKWCLCWWVFVHVDPSKFRQFPSYFFCLIVCSFVSPIKIQS